MIKIIGKHKKQELASYIIPFLVSQAPTNIFAAQALGEIKNPLAISHLIESYIETSDITYRKTVIRALASFKRDEIILFFHMVLGHFKDGSEEIPHALIIHRKNPQCKELLSKCLYGGSKTQDQAIKVLKKYFPEIAGNMLLQKLKNAKQQEYEKVLRAISELGDTSVIPELIKIYSEKKMRKMYWWEYTLRELTNRNDIYSAPMWKRWLMKK